MSDICDVTDKRREIEEEIKEKARLSFKPAISEYCYECNIFIPLKRQEVTGGTDMCVQCLSLQEIRQRGYK